MTYNQFLKLHNNLQKLLICLGVLTTKRFIIKINNSPDYDISKYEREADDDYFFNNSWDFSNKLQSVVDINFIDNTPHTHNITRTNNRMNIVLVICCRHSP